MLVKFFSLIALSAASAMAAATGTSTAADPFNPALPLDTRSNYYPISQLEDRELTNAMRLAKRLPLRPPVRRGHRGQDHNGGNPHQPRPSNTPGGGDDGCTDGHLEVRDGSGNCVGYVGKDWNDYGQYGLCDKDDVDLRLVVSVDLDLATGGYCDIKTKNGPDTNYPYFGGVSGYTSDCGCPSINNNSKNYCYLGGTTQTTPHSVPKIGSNSFTQKTKVARHFQSSIFSYNTDTQEITTQWTNEDNSSPETHIGYSHGSLILAGDKDSFSQYLDNDAQWYQLFFVPV